MKKPFYIASAFEIKKKEQTFLNARRIQLLKAIEQEGSIRSASLHLKMSYQQAWHFIKEMNEIAPLPLVIYKRGGSNGGGSELTKYGKKTIQQFDELQHKINTFNQTLSENLWMGDFF